MNSNNLAELKEEFDIYNFYIFEVNNTICLTRFVRSDYEPLVTYIPFKYNGKYLKIEGLDD